VKEIKKFENRLDQANQKYNSIVAYNKTLREQINTLRRERIVFEEIYKKLETELMTKTEKCKEIVKIA
jgi:coiled-coil domain-containing protein 63/114